MARVEDNRKEKTSFCIIDSQSIKNADSAENKGYDAGKKGSGIKRHIAVGTNGLPYAIHITTANVTDRNGAIELLELNKEDLCSVVSILRDGGYTGEKFTKKVKESIGSNIEVAKRSELHKFTVIPKRWIVERTFNWFEKCRRLWKILNQSSIKALIWLFWLLLV